MERRSSRGVVQPLLTDQYQITMAYAYWKSGKTEDIASFDLFFRKCPFKGEFTIFAGLSECLQFLKDFQFSSSDIEYLKSCLPNCEEEFFSFLASLSPKSVRVEAILPVLIHLCHGRMTCREPLYPCFGPGLAAMDT